MSAAAPFLSILIPAYNEARRIPDSLHQVAGWLGRQPFSCELIVVDDGSSDGTSDAVRELAPDLPLPVALLRYESNRGKGHALKVGFAAARGSHVLFSDADLSVPIGFAEVALRCLEGGADVAIGTRKTGAASIDVRQPWYRESLGKAFTFIVRKLIADVSDVTCGFKAFRGDAGRDLFSRIRVDDWSFDAELLLITHRRGYRVEEFPVRWEDRPGTKVRILRDVFNSLIGLVQIRFNAAAGRYDQAFPIEVETQAWSNGGIPRAPMVSGRGPR